MAIPTDEFARTYMTATDRIWICTLAFFAATGEQAYWVYALTYVVWSFCKFAESRDWFLPKL